MIGCSYHINGASLIRLHSASLKISFAGRRQACPPSLVALLIILQNKGGPVDRRRAESNCNYATIRRGRDSVDLSYVFIHTPTLYPRPHRFSRGRNSSHEIYQPVVCSIASSEIHLFVPPENNSNRDEGPKLDG